MNLYQVTENYSNQMGDCTTNIYVVAEHLWEVAKEYPKADGIKTVKLNIKILKAEQHVPQGN